MEASGSDHRPDVYREGDRWVYRASAIGGCIRALAACRLGLREAPLEQKAADVLEAAYGYGVANEPVVLDELSSDGWVVGDRQKVVEWPVGSILIRGHVDAVAVKDGEARVVEVKTAGADRFERFARGGFEALDDPIVRKWAYQVSFYMARTGLKGVVAVKLRPKEGESDPRVLHLVWLDAPIVSEWAILQRAKRIEQIAADGRLDRLECDVEPSPFCSFRYLCVAPKRGEDHRLQGDEAQAIDEWAQAYLEALEREREAASDKAQAKARLDELLGGREMVVTGRYRVGYSVYEDEDYDLSAIEAHFGRQALDPFRRRTVRRRFGVRPTQEGGGKGAIRSTYGTRR